MIVNVEFEFDFVGNKAGAIKRLMNELTINGVFEGAVGMALEADDALGEVELCGIEVTTAEGDDTVHQPEVATFIRDMERAGLQIRPYAGRFYYFGPCVHVDDVSDAVSLTSVKCSWDQLGLGYVVYPRVGDKEWYDQHEGLEDDEDDDDE
jgi:hypothetical protein